MNKIIEKIQYLNELRIPTNPPREIPFEIALNVIYLEQDIQLIAQSAIINSLKTNLLDSYRRYYKAMHIIYYSNIYCHY